MNPILKQQLFKTFRQLLLDLRNKKEIEKFLTDFFTDEELETYVKRLAIAYWLKKGRSAENIRENLKANSAEISTAAKLLPLPGLKLALKHLEAEEWANVWSEKIKKLGISR